MEFSPAWKLQELYAHWFALPETQALVDTLLQSLHSSLPLADVSLVVNPAQCRSSQSPLKSTHAAHTSVKDGIPPLLEIADPVHSIALPESDPGPNRASAPLDGEHVSCRSARGPSVVGPGASVLSAGSGSWVLSAGSLSPPPHCAPRTTSDGECVQCQLALPPTEAQALAQAPLDTKRAAQAQQLTELQALLRGRGLRRGSALSPSDFAAILPQLPGGGLSSYLCRSLWLKLHAFASGSAYTPAGRPAMVTVIVFLDYFESHLALKNTKERAMQCLSEGHWGGHGWESDAWFAPAALKPLLEEVLDRHPSLDLLQGDSDSQRNYSDTVIQRILYTLDPLRAGRVTDSQMRRAGGTFCDALDSLDGDATEDICLEGMALARAPGHPMV